MVIRTKRKGQGSCNLEASVDKGTGLDVPRYTAEKPECSVARIGRPSGGPREHKHDLEKGLVV